MDNRNKSNVLLVEILIAVLFFMLSATVLVQVFATSRNLTVRAGVESQALAEAQNVLDALIAADDPEAVMEDMSFQLYHGAWSRSYGEYTLYVESAMRPETAGVMQEGNVRAFYRNRNVDMARQEDEELFSLPFARYREVEA